MENCVHIINPASKGKKRSFPIPKQSYSPNKRVVLSDLTNSSTLCSNPNQESLQTDVSVSFLSAHDNKFFYAPFMYQHLHSLEIEEKRRPLPNYMKKIQKDVTAGMREILVDWLVEVAEEYKLASDTLFLTVSYIDRFLSSHCLSRNKLQLLGVSSMLVASKFEEVSPPHVEDYCYITDNTYTKQECPIEMCSLRPRGARLGLTWQKMTNLPSAVSPSKSSYFGRQIQPNVVQMEKDLLNFLELELSNPTPKTFVRIFIRAAQGDIMPSCSTFEFLCWFLVELSLLDYSCLRFLPSIVAASAIFIAKFTIQPEQHPWGLKMQRYSGYKPCELKECVLAVHDLQLRRTSLSSQAIREKYSKQKLKCVAALVSPEIPVSYFEDIDE